MFFERRKAAYQAFVEKAALAAAAQLKPISPDMGAASSQVESTS
jgi:hypothetical protein